MIARIILLQTLLLSLVACSQSKKDKTEFSMQTNPLSNVSVFTSNFANYSMEIEAAGLASIPKASISEEGTLFVAYAYESGGENRNGTMILKHLLDHRFEGTWKTVADNGNSYQGTLYFVFDEGGNAQGTYKFGASEYKISIQIK